MIVCEVLARIKHIQPIEQSMALFVAYTGGLFYCVVGITN